MYLGVVTNRHFKSERIKKFYNDYSDYPNLSDSIGYISVDLCNQNGKLNSIFISTSKCSYQGDLVNLVYENGNWIVKEIIDDYNVKKLSINQILQLEKLIELEKLKLKEEKKEYAESYLKRDSLFFEIVRRELRIEDLVKKFNLAIKNVSTTIEYINLKKYSS